MPQLQPCRSSKFHHYSRVLSQLRVDLCYHACILHLCTNFDTEIFALYPLYHRTRLLAHAAATYSACTKNFPIALSSDDRVRMTHTSSLILDAELATSGTPLQSCSDVITDRPPGSVQVFPLLLQSSCLFTLKPSQSGSITYTEAQYKFHKDLKMILGYSKGQ